MGGENNVDDPKGEAQNIYANLNETVGYDEAYTCLIALPSSVSEELLELIPEYTPISFLSIARQAAEDAIAYKIMKNESPSYRKSRRPLKRD